MEIKELINREIWSLKENSNQFDINTFDSLNSFSARKRYADENLTRLASGTARIVYLMDDGKKVLKLAKNKKGLDQNDVECSIGQDYYYKDIVTEVYDCHDDDLWIISEYAKKITPNRFKELVGFSIDEVSKFLTNFESKQKGKQKIHHLENSDEMWDDRFISKLAELSDSHDILIGDLNRISSYGETIKEGKPTVVLTDYGLSKDVFATHYQKVRESIDENYFDLDEDLNYEDDLMNYVNPDEIRDGGYAGFALLPNSISQGGLNNANENFDLFDYNNANNNTIKKAISYIKNFNLGKIEDLLSNTELKELYKSYMVAIQNIEKSLQLSKDDLTFFNKMLNVQDFLKKHKIIKEDLIYWHVDDASPEKDEFSLITEQGSDETLDRVANFVANKLGYDQPSYIDSGENGVAYDLKNGQVLKITLDKSEAIESLNIKGKQNKHIANIYKVFQIDYPELSYLDIYAIILEKIDTSKQFNIAKMIEELDQIFFDEFYESVSTILAIYHTDLQYYNNTYKDVINNILNEISPDKKEFFNQYLQLADEVRRNNIKSADYINERNLGYKNGNLAFFDVGASVKENFGKKKPKKLKMVEDGSSLYTTLQGTVNPGDTAWNLQERIMSWMPKSKAVSVKKKCRIGGGKLGKGYACNQGDINALNISDINDDNKKRRKDNWVNIAESVVKRKKNDEIFDYTSAIKDLWHDIIKKGKEFYSVNFDTENNDTTNEKKTFYFKKDLRKNQPIKYEINAELWQAGGDWEFPVMYFKLELTNDYGLKGKEHEKKKEFPWDLESAVLDKKFIIIPPVKAGNKFTEHDKGKNYKYTAWDEDLLRKKNVDEKDIRITDNDKKKAWKWLEEKLENAVDQRHEKLDESKKDNTHNLIMENLIFEYIEQIQKILSEKNIDIHDFAKKIANKLGYHQVHYLGEGTQGYAFSLTSKILMKITSDRSEAYEAIKLKGKNNDHIGNFYNVYELEEPYNNIFIILREQLDVDVDRVINLENDSKYEYKNYYLEFFEKNNDFLLKDEYKYLNGYQMLISLESERYNYDEIENIINKIGRNKFPSTLQYLGVIKDFLKNNIKSYDFGEQNFGFKSNGNLAYYDVGYSKIQHQSTINKLKVESMKKNNKSLLKEEKIKFGVLMLYFDITKWNNIINKIKEEDLYDDGSGTFGREEFPHVTVLYGFHPEVKGDDLNEFVKDLKPFDLKVKGVSLFENKDFDVVKFDIEPNEEILKLRENVATLPHTLTYKDYKPHMTIAYVKSGEGKKYVKNFEKPIILRGNKLVFSNKNKQKSKWNLNEMITEGQISSLNELPFKKKVEEKGGKIYSVGGAVRDEFLGKESKDLDILITGIPMNELEILLSEFGKVNAVGKSFGILLFTPEGSKEGIDIAIPRKEESTGKGGHKGFDVVSDHTLPIETDLSRRDFTINAIAKDGNGNLIDPFGGEEDLKNKIIRVVNPDAFSDDPLRMLRGIQFASRFGFEIEPKTMELIKNNASRIKEISGERILEEFKKIITKNGDVLYAVDLLRETGLFKEIFGKDTGINRALPWKEISTLGEFIFLLLQPISDTPAEIYKTTLKGNIDTQKEIMALNRAWLDSTDNVVENRIVAHNMYKLFPESFDSKILPLPIKKAAGDLKSTKYPLTLKELQVNGNDLQQIGLKGKEIGDTLKSLLIKVYSDQLENKKEILLNSIKY